MKEQTGTYLEVSALRKVTVTEDHDVTGVLRNHAMFLRIIEDRNPGDLDPDL